VSKKKKIIKVGRCVSAMHDINITRMFPFTFHLMHDINITRMFPFTFHLMHDINITRMFPFTFHLMRRLYASPSSGVFISLNHV